MSLWDILDLQARLCLGWFRQDKICKASLPTSTYAPPPTGGTKVYMTAKEMGPVLFSNHAFIILTIESRKQSAQ